MLMKREDWLRKRAADLSGAIYEYVVMGQQTSEPCRMLRGFLASQGVDHAIVLGWIQELADVWELIELEKEQRNEQSQ